VASVVVVEDDPTTALAVQATFEGAGHQVRLITDPQLVLSTLVDELPDALVLDIVLPGTSGWEILEAIRAEPATSSLPVLLLSSLDSSADRIQGLRGGASDYLTKPFVPDELLLRVEGMLEKAVLSTADLEGNLENFPFWELLQSLQHGRRSGRLELKGRVSGSVDLTRGAVVVGQQGRLRAKEAVLALSEATGGRFVFHPMPPDDELMKREAIFVNGLIMSSAVIQDELDRRRDFLPSHDQHLEAVAREMPMFPETFQEVPVEVVHRYLSGIPGASLRTLLGAELAAPNKIRLSLAWLCEQGLVRPQAAATPAPEADAPPEKAATNATAGTVAPVHQLLLCQPEAWEQLLQRLGGPSGAASSEAEQALIRQLTLRRGGSARLRRGGADVHLHVLILEQSTMARAIATLPLCSCLVLWLAGDESIERADPIIRSFEQRSAQDRGIRNRGVVVAPTGRTFRSAHQRLGDSPRWSVSSAIPESLSKLVDLAL